MPHHCSRRNHSRRVARGKNSNTRSRRKRVMNSLKRIKNTLMRRGRRSRRYNIVPEPEHESNHNNGRYFRYNNKYAKRGRFDHNTMNHYRLRRPLTRNHLQQFQTNMSQSALAQRRRKTKRSTAPPQHVLDAISARSVPIMWGY